MLLGCYHWMCAAAQNPNWNEPAAGMNLLHLLPLSQAMSAVESLLDGIDFKDDAAVILDQALGPLLSTLASDKSSVSCALSSIPSLYNCVPEPASSSA